LKVPVLALAAMLAIGPATLASAQPDSEYPIRPGYWESRNKMGIGPITLQDKVEKKCVTPKEIGKMLDGPSNRHYECTYPTKVVEGGKITMQGQCVHRKKGTKISLRLTGDYEPEAFNMRATLKWGILTGSGTSSAKRIGDDCPPGSEIK
jgi:hypothetical protein